MNKKARLVTSVLIAAVVATGIAALLASPTASAGSCWKVDCNTCCQVGGKVICTQRLCS